MKTRTNKRNMYRGGDNRYDVLTEHYEVLGPRDGDTIEIKEAIEKAIKAFMQAKEETNTERSLKLKLNANQMLEHIVELRDLPPPHPVALIRQYAVRRGGYYKRKTNKKRKTKRR